MRQLKMEGLCKHIGVSNFTIKHLESLRTQLKMERQKEKETEKEIEKETEKGTAKEIVKDSKQNEIHSVSISHAMTAKHGIMASLEDDERLDIAVNQVEWHLGLHNETLLAYTRQHGIRLEAYSPLAQAHPAVFTHPVVLHCAKVHGCTPAQVCLRWCLQRKVPLSVRSSSEQHIKQNIATAIN